MTVQANFQNTIITQPGSLTHIDATDLNNIQLGFSGVVAVVGTCASGQPKTPLLFTSPGQLKSVLGSGNAYDAARAVFSPSTQIVEGNPVRVQQVYVVRVDPATQSTKTFLDGASANSIIFTSKDYGLQANQICVKVENSTTSQSLTPPSNDGSKKVTVTYQGASEVYDDLGVNTVLSVIYTGNGTTATLTTSSTQLTTTLSGQSDGSLSLTVPYSSYSTIQQVADYINAQQGYTATIRTTQPTQYLAANLDYVSTQNIKTPTAVNLYGVVYDIVSKVTALSTLVTVTRTSPGNLPPANISTTFLTGGTTPAASNSDWQAAVNTLQSVRTNFLIGTSTSSSVFSIFSAFADQMQGKNEMHVHLGAPASQSFTALQTLASGINDVNVNLWFQSIYFQNDQGVSTLYDPWMAAALAAGFQGGTAPGTSFVNKSFNILGESHDTTTIDLFNNADQLILARLSFLRFNDATKSWNVVRALTTYSQDNNDYNTEPGIRSATNFAVYEIRNDIQIKFLGARTLYTEAGGTASSAARELIAFAKTLEDANVIIKGNTVTNGKSNVLPAVVIDNVSISGDILRLRYGIRPIGAINFIFHDVTLKKVEQVATS